MIPRVPAAAAILSVAMLCCASCSSPAGIDRSEQPAPSSTVPTQSSSTTTTSSPAPAQPSATPPATSRSDACTFEGGTSRQERPPGPTKRFLVDVQVDSDACTDRVVFSFEPSTDGVSPGFSVEYRDGPFRDSSNRETTVSGSAYLVVWVRPAAIARIDLSGVEETYRGPEIVNPDGDTVAVQQVGLFSAFEGNVRFVIGLDATRPFRLGLGNEDLVVEIGGPSSRDLAGSGATR